MHLTKPLSFVCLTFFMSLSPALAVDSHLPESPTRQWLKQTTDFSTKKILENISPADAAPGAVIAAKTRHDPNYYYHWVRDAGITTDSLISTYRQSKQALQKNLISQKIFDYLGFSFNIQHTNTLSGLGEPKFNVDGSAFNDPWARPQNDSPALRAISLIHWAYVLLEEGKETTVRDKLYKAVMPADSPIKMDLEYISHHWQEPSYDIWEEVKGTHFYTLMVERRALLEGAALAHRLGDQGAADWYYKQGKLVEKRINQFWDPKQNMIIATFNRVDGINYKVSNIDTAVILGLLHGNMHDGFFAMNDPRVLATLEKIIRVFSQLYPINQRSDIPGTAIGRYPEDKYSGSGFNGGNPWPLCTLAVAEAYYEAARLSLSAGNKAKAAEFAYRADQFVDRVRYHAHQDGSLNEQIDRNNGFMTSVSDLTWNYAALSMTRQTMLALD